MWRRREKSCNLARLGVAPHVLLHRERRHSLRPHTTRTPEEDDEAGEDEEEGGADEEDIDARFPDEMVLRDLVGP